MLLPTYNIFLWYLCRTDEGNDIYCAWYSFYFAKDCTSCLVEKKSSLLLLVRRHIFNDNKEVNNLPMTSR